MVAGEIGPTRKPCHRTTTWSLPIPADLEGEYQIDLRGTDVLGNLLVTSNVYPGIIDTLAPRDIYYRGDPADRRARRR